MPSLSIFFHHCTITKPLSCHPAYRKIFSVIPHLPHYTINSTPTDRQCPRRCYVKPHGQLKAKVTLSVHYLQVRLDFRKEPRTPVVSFHLSRSSQYHTAIAFHIFHADEEYMLHPPLAARVDHLLAYPVAICMERGRCIRKFESRMHECS
jgi:hypothetical protein